jgi:hypothetical protein
VRGEGLSGRPREPLDDGVAKGHQVARDVRFPPSAKQHGLFGEGRGPKVELEHGQERRSATTCGNLPPGLGVLRMAQARLGRVLRRSQRIHLLCVAGLCLPGSIPRIGGQIGRRTGAFLHVRSPTWPCRGECLSSRRRRGSVSAQPRTGSEQGHSRREGANGHVLPLPVDGLHQGDLA